MDAGDIHRAHLNDERTHLVLVVSDRWFHQPAGRAIVVPALDSPPDEVSPSQQVEIDGVVDAVDMMRSIPVDRLLDRVDRCPADMLARVRTVVRHIT